MERTLIAAIMIPALVLMTTMAGAAPVVSCVCGDIQFQEPVRATCCQTAAGDSDAACDMHGMGINNGCGVTASCDHHAVMPGVADVPTVVQFTERASGPVHHVLPWDALNGSGAAYPAQPLISPPHHVVIPQVLQLILKIDSVCRI